MNVCVIGEQGKQHKLINLVINIFFVSFGRLIEEELFTDKGADLLGKGVCSLPCLSHKFGQVTLCSLCFESNYNKFSNSCTSGGKNVTLKAK